MLTDALAESLCFLIGVLLWYCRRTLQIEKRIAKDFHIPDDATLVTQITKIGLYLNIPLWKTVFLLKIKIFELKKFQPIFFNFLRNFI